MKNTFKLLSLTISLIVVFLTTTLRADPNPFRINEVMSSNNASIADEDGDHSDWIEILNTSKDSASIGRYGLSDSNSDKFKWIFPDTVIGPGEFLLVWASGKNRKISGKPLHCNFSISQDGEDILLTSPDGTLQDQLKPVFIPTNNSIGRDKENGANWVFFEKPTPEAINTSESFFGVLSKPVFSHTPGFYSSDFQLTITHPDKDVALHYTLDGSEPTENSPLYDSPILIKDRSNEENRLSNIRTGVGWKAPESNVAKGTVVRVKAFKPGSIPSPVLSGSFFVFPGGKNRYPLPVVSIITNEKYFFNDTIGIYVPGINHVEGNDGTGNYYKRGDDWEREGNFEYFNKNGTLSLSQITGFRIHGGYSRRYPIKGLRVYARNSYGEKYLNERFFHELPYSSYKTILLRPSGNDWSIILMRDAAAQLIVRHLNFDTQAYSPAIVFINGEYWGIKNIREKYDKHYLERVYGVDPENIDLISGIRDVEEGSLDYYQEMSKYITENNMSDTAHYARVSTYMDIDNYINYYSSQIYFGNNDWPQNNIAFWRLRTPYSPNAQPGHDGRFRWMMFDVDRSFAFGYLASDSIDLLIHVTDTSASHSKLILSLLNNSEFKREFINRQADLLNSTFLPHRIISIIDSIAENIKPVIEEHIRRWNKPSSISSWNNSIKKMRSFAHNRPHFLRSHIMKYFNLPDTCQITLLSDAKQGIIKINSLLIDENLPGIRDTVYPWKGGYFKGNPVILEALAKPGYEFDHWLADSVVHEENPLEINPDDNLKIKAVFTYDGFEQKTIHYFHFNTIKNKIDNGEKIYSDYSIISSASIQYQGSSAGYIDDVDGTTENAIMDAPSGKALRARNPSDTRCLVFNIPTEGFKDIVFSYAVCRTNNGATRQSLYINTTGDESGWTLFTSGIRINEKFETKTFDFSKIEGVNDNSSFKVRLTFDENSSGLSGNNRFDNVTVIGTSIYQSQDSIPPTTIKPVQYDFSMIAIDPNPIHDRISTIFSLPARAHVVLGIYDMHGRLIAKPVNEFRNEGIHNVFWRLGKTPAGVYICRIKAGSSQVAKKIIVRSR